VPVALVALVLIPAIAGSLRLVELAGGPLLLPANPRITASSAPVVVHSTSPVAYETLGACQFSTSIRPAAAGPPTKHQLALMIWLAVFPTLTVLNLALGRWLRPLTPVVRTFVLATIAVPIVIYALRAREEIMSSRYGVSRGSRV